MYDQAVAPASVDHEGRAFQRVKVPVLRGFDATVGPLGKPPAPSTPVNISRGGLKIRTGVDLFTGSEGTECIIRFVDAEQRMVPDRALARVKRVEESAGYFLISLEFSHPLERLSI